jgi:membrane protease YdiL (CAAX protease family)
MEMDKMQAPNALPADLHGHAFELSTGSEPEPAGGRLSPLRWPLSVLLVLVPSLFGTLLIQVIFPRILKTNPIPFLYLYLPWWIVFSGSITSLAALIAYRLEGNSFTWRHFKARFRLHMIRGAEWRWLWLLLLTFAGAVALMQLIGPRLASIPGLAMPVSFPPELNPSDPAGLVPGEFMGVTLAGKWWLPAVYFIGWVMNIMGEELWFRGYMLPRQEAAYGGKAWILHGVVWSLHHLWQRWTLPVLAPYSFLWSYIIQRGRNTTIPIVVHGAGNLIPLVVIVRGVSG